MCLEFKTKKLLASGKFLLDVGSITKTNSTSRFTYNKKQSCTGYVLTLYIDEHR